MTALTLNLTHEPQTRSRMKKIFAEINVASVTKLTITGTLTEEGLLYIREQMGDTLKELDLSGVSSTEVSDSNTATPLFET